ncbi:F-box/FBD/LRR-repeat protein At5g22660-like [Silene latifolia]|uniref:F-box/FBD/LRR-repeat protein At5g22660-like n=1 Tax=Silene latifolia TaxID=37657 RepID=UPI003D77ABA9
MEQHHRWSSLPDDIVSKIISHLNLSDFVITISSTIFSIKQIYTERFIANSVYEPRYWTIFDNLFDYFTTPVIDTFYLNLHVSFYKDPLCWPIIDTWAHRLRSTNIRHFTINTFDSFEFSIRVWPPSIFRMHSLLSLTLYISFKEIARSDDQLSMILPPNLKKLHLVSSNYQLLEELISGCPSLEDLSLTLDIDQKSKSSISITSEKLKRLYINLYKVSNYYCKVIIIIDAPILEHFRYFTRDILSMQMLDSILNVKSLALHVEDYWDRKFNTSPKKTVFPNLRHLTLSLPWKLYQKMFDEQLLCCPNLKVLKLHFSNYYDEYKAMILNEDAKFALVEQVKRLEVYMIDGKFSKQRLNLLTWLLRSAKVLEKLVLSSNNLWDYNKLAKSQFLETLFECAESTSRCQIQLLGGCKLD